jgi:hypothetical protein
MKRITQIHVSLAILVCLIIGHFLLRRSPPQRDKSNPSLLYQCQIAQKRYIYPTDLIEFAESLQILKQYHETPTPLHLNDTSSKQELYECMLDLEKLLFPWIEIKPFLPFFKNKSKYKNVEDLNATFTPGSKGIVICSGDKFFEFTVHLIETLYAFKVELPPIVIGYMGDSDLSVSRQAYLRQVMNVSLLDVTQHFDNSILKLEGWAVKPFAILAAPFQEVLFLDADTVVIQNPLKLFNDTGYIKDGLLLFRDRTCFQGWPKQKLWLNRNLVKPWSDTLLNSDMYKGLTDHQVDSSMLFVDKHRKLFSLLAACKLNMYTERADFYKHFLGDKESFWFGAEMVQESVQFMPLLPGVFGRFKKDDKDLLCGRQLFFDREGQPFYFNKAVVLVKGDKRLLEVPTHYDYAGRWVEGDGTNECLYTEGMPVTPELAERFTTLIKSFHYIENDL